MILEERIWSTKELAQWFGISYSYLQKNRKKKLEELKAFAVFQDLGGKKGILIKEVIEPVYSRKSCENRRKIVESVPVIIGQLKNKETNKFLTSFKQLAEIGIKMNQLSIKSSTGVKYAKEGQVKYYGDEKTSPYCKRIWAVKKEEGYGYLTEEQQEFLRGLIVKQYGERYQEQQDAKIELKALRAQGELSEVEYKEELEKILEKEREEECRDDFNGIRWDFKAEYGDTLVKALEVEDNKIIEWKGE